MKCDHWTTDLLLIRQVAGTKLPNNYIFLVFGETGHFLWKKNPKLCGLIYFNGKTINYVAQLKILQALETVGINLHHDHHHQYY